MRISFSPLVDPFTLFKAAILTYCILLTGVVQSRCQNMTGGLSTLQREIDRMPIAVSNERLAKLNIPAHLLYFSGGWETGTVLPSSSTVAATPQQLRYNVVLQRLEIQDTYQQVGYRSLKPDSVSGFTLRSTNGTNYRFLAKPYYTENRQRQHAFFEVLTLGTIQLMILHEFYIKPAEVVEMFNVESKPEEYRRSTRLFAGDATKDVVTELTLAKQTVLKLFNKAERTDLAAYVTGNHLNYADINDVVRLVNYYNGLHPENRQ